MNTERLIKWAIRLAVAGGGAALIYVMAPFLFLWLTLVGAFAAFAFGVNRLARWYRASSGLPD